jgi:hypothetical protein
VRPCGGDLIDINCIQYAGIDFECINTATEDTLISVLLNILNVYFPVEECCQLEATATLETYGLVTYCYGENLTEACLCESEPFVIYSTVATPLLEVGDFIYSDVALTTAVDDGYYSNSSISLVYHIIDGVIVEIIASCPTTTSSTTTSSSTTATPQVNCLICCKSPAGNPIVVNPPYPNIPLTIGDIVVDSNGIYWIVIAPSTVTSGYTSWGAFTFVANYPNPGTAISVCKEMSAAPGIPECPGVTPTTIPQPFYLCYSDEDCLTACNCVESTVMPPIPLIPQPFYSNCTTTLGLGCTLYTDITYTITAPAGFYSDGSVGFCYEVDDFGEIIDITNCLPL